MIIYSNHSYNGLHVLIKSGKGKQNGKCIKILSPVFLFISLMYKSCSIVSAAYKMELESMLHIVYQFYRPQGK